MTPDLPTAAERVTARLVEIAPVAVAVSGGVDSLTLAHLAHRELVGGATMFHAVSAAVPSEATLRVRRHAAANGWLLHEIDAGEMADERYLANPAERCFYCKSDLYGVISSLTDHVIVSGTNTDDLDDYRPGLKAADRHRVRHPFVDAGVGKPTIRSIARDLALVDIADLPAAPCLASRIETGLRVTPRRLSTVEAVETLVRSKIDASDVRCRLRASGVVVEVDTRLTDLIDPGLLAEIRDLLSASGVPAAVSVEPYRRGSAFLVPESKATTA